MVVWDNRLKLMHFASYALEIHWYRLCVCVVCVCLSVLVCVGVHVCLHAFVFVHVFAHSGCFLVEMVFVCFWL